MIDEYNVNHKVGMLSIKCKNSNPVDQEVLMTMVSKYQNVYSLIISDYNHTVDRVIHDHIQ